MASIFSRIIAGELPCHKIAESDRYFAFLDIHPVAKGHTLVIPKEETDYLFDLEDDALGGLMSFAKRIARALDQAIDCKRVGLMVIGTEVPHAHLHLIPFEQERQVSVMAPKLKFTPEELAEIAASIRAKLPAE
jgi:histidine triad (HIT) family protein